MLHTKDYEVVQLSWEEKRRDLLDGLLHPLPRCDRMLRSECMASWRGSRRL